MIDNKNFENKKYISYQLKTDFSSTCKDTTILIILFVKEMFIDLNNNSKFQIIKADEYSIYCKKMYILQNIYTLIIYKYTKNTCFERYIH